MKVKSRSLKKLQSAGKAKTDTVSNALKVNEEHGVVEEKGLTLPELKTDVTKFTCYSSIIGRSGDQPVANDDVDRLQMELEFMLSTIAVQNRLLCSQVEVINIAEESKPKKPAILILPKKKQSQPDEARTDELVSVTETVDPKTSDLLNNKLLQSELYKEVENYEHPDNNFKTESLCSNRQSFRKSESIVPSIALPIAHNDRANQFWEFVEHYCGEVKSQTIKFFEGLMETYELYGNEEYLIIQPFDDSRKNIQVNKVAPSISIKKNKEPNENKPKKIESDPCCQPGFVVQRLVSALIEETPASNTAASNSPRGKRGKAEDEIEKVVVGTAGSASGYHKSIKKLKKEFAGFISKSMEHTELEEGYRKLPLFHTPLCIEIRMRTQLENIGFIKVPDDDDYDIDDDDDVSCEINRCRKELITMSGQNEKILGDLLSKLKRQCERQSVRVDIKNLNSEIYDITSRSQSLKLSKKELCPRDVVTTWKSLKNREILTTRLTEM